MVRVSPGRKLLERRIQAAKEGIDLLSVAQDLTTLRKKGERWRGKCPICDNGTHSDAFSLDDNLGLWHCFADRKSTRLNSSHLVISYAVFCLKKKTKKLNSRHFVIAYAVFCLKKKKI